MDIIGFELKPKIFVVYIAFLLTNIFEITFNIYKLMAYSAIIETLDRLTVKSIMRGSTSTILGVIGTLTVIILCMAIYIPPANSIFKGNYF
jgi:hypothetical protein